MSTRTQGELRVWLSEFGTRQGRDQTEVFETASMPARNAKAPGGWQMLHVQTIT